MEEQNCNCSKLYVESLIELHKITVEKLKDLDRRLNTLYKLVFKINNIELVDILAKDLKNISNNIVENE